MVVKYTDTTLVLKTSFHSDWSSEKRFSFSSSASSLFGSPLGPEIPALVMSRSICFSFLRISETSFSKSSFLVTSQGPTPE